MKIYSLSLAIIFFLSFKVLAADIDINKARNLVSNKKYFDALKIVAPCLKSSSIKSIVNLEECLYLGESIAEDAIRDLNKGFQKAFDKGASFPSWEGLLPYNALGLKLGYDTPGANIVYENDFFKQLQAVLPNSKYREEVEYTLLDRNASVNNWEKWNSELEHYIKKNPSGTFTLRAKLALAYNYHDLWNLMHPGHDWSFLVVTFQKDAKLANTYKVKALKLYKGILLTSDKSSLKDYELADIKERIDSLEKNKASGCVHILRGYD
ncbi:MAG: hypothetical protein FD174_739 [Geobacteraceae bacterium]|nr:MAG: hypothetical protein FD174_739 [Geobacteraceae bacterium]